jgi:Multicopper oxidase
MKDIKRRDFLKYASGTAAALVIGSEMPWIFKDEAYAAVKVQELNFHITDAMKQMVTFNTGLATNVPALCYFWIFKEARFPADCPGPNIFCTEGDLIKVTLTNDLDEDHSFFIKGVVDSGPIKPGATATIRFKAPRGGTYLYHDNLNAPVNRVMGLHGAFVSMPRAARPGHNLTPYSRPTANVQKMYDDFGFKIVNGVKIPSTHYPGLRWEDGDSATNTTPCRQHIWLCHDASPKMFLEVGNLAAGVLADPVDFTNKITQDPLVGPVFDAQFNYRPQYFTIVGQSGHFSHNSPFICPTHRVGEPAIVRCLHAGVQTHSMHIHANHVWVTSINGVVQNNPLWVDTMTLHPMDTWEYTIPYMRPPDIPNICGIGPMHVPIAGLNNKLAHTPMTSKANPLIAGSTAHPVWPPTEEHAMFLPAVGTVAGVTSIAVQLSPMCYPMHDHSEPTQTAQGGNYNNGLLSGINFTGDRTSDAGVLTFPNAPALQGPSAVPGTAETGTGTPAGPEI